MKYIKIDKEDTTNGIGLRTTLWLSGCSHKCEGCHNPQTWDCDSGIPFDEAAKQELFEQLDKPYISGLTLSGGDPLHENNVREVNRLLQEIKAKFPNKTIWIYTGYTWEQIFHNYDPMQQSSQYRQDIISLADVLVDGRFIKQLADVSYHWAGSTNQRVIDVKKTLQLNEMVLWS